MFTRLRPYVANFELTGEALDPPRASGGGRRDPRSEDRGAAGRDPVGRPEAWRTPDFATTASPVVPVHFRKGDLDVRYFSLVTTVGTPQDVTLQEIRVESFFPAAHDTLTALRP